MEVSGRKGDQSETPATISRILCNPCTYNDESNEADGFCQNCKEYLCKVCITHHKSFRISRNHVILDRDNMPLDDTEQPNTLCTEPCDQHTDKFVEYYCQTHDVLGCGVCTTVNHRTCKVDYIPDIAKTFKDSSEYKKFVESIEVLETMARECQDRIVNHLDTIEEFHSSAIVEIQKYRAEINTYLDKREAELMDMARNIKEDGRQLMETLKEGSQTIQQEISDMKTQLEENTENLARLFLTCKRSKSKIDRFKSECASLASQTKIQKVHFKPNNAIVDLMRDKAPIGEFKENTDFSETYISKDYEISVKTSDDIDTPWITGIALLSTNKVLIADRSGNTSLKIVDTQTRQVASQLKLSSGPWKVTYLPESQAAVTLPDERMVQIVSTSGQLEPVRKFKTNGSCHGICFHDGQVIVTLSNSANVELFNVHGDALKIITSDNVFNDPLCASLAHMRSSDVICVANYSTPTVSIITKDGEIVSHHTVSELSCLDSVTGLLDNHIAVCGRHNHEIQVLADDGNGLKKVCEWKLEVNPMAIAFCPLNKVLFVSNYTWAHRGNIHVYTMIQRT